LQLKTQELSASVLIEKYDVFWLVRKSFCEVWNF
jgi:hypothetical protein